MNAVCESFQAAKDAGFKVVAHMMPDLPNVGLERDINAFIVSCIHPACVFAVMQVAVNRASYIYILSTDIYIYRYM